ncbi:MAG: hypothetical protein PHF54_02660 [Candidatus Pacebacteria bacterium]|nr:hypothetical protein [Candidatus Paceibacterota bacterium]
MNTWPAKNNAAITISPGTNARIQNDLKYTGSIYLCFKSSLADLMKVISR